MNKKSNILLLAASLVTFAAQAQETHQYIDLNLPSGTLWAIDNIGTDSLFIWAAGLDNPNGNDVYNLGQCIQGSANDPATQAWGEEWCTPTLEQWWELLHYVRYDYSSSDGMYRVRYYDTDGDGVFDTPNKELSFFIPYPRSTYNQKYGSYNYGAYWTSNQIMESWPAIAPTDTCFEWYCEGIDVSEVIDGWIHPYSEHGYCYGLSFTNLNAGVELVIGAYNHTKMIRPVRKEKATAVRKVRAESEKQDAEYRLGKIVITSEGKKYLDM